MFENLGAWKHWFGFHTKLVYMRPFLHHLAYHKPDEIVILTDGGDVSFGGCDRDDLLARYVAVVNAGRWKTPVVVGGDNSIWPHVLYKEHMKYHSFWPDKWAQFGVFGFKKGLYDHYQHHGGYNYVNSGFIMGPAKDLHVVVDCMDKHGWIPWTGKYDDQYALTECMFMHPHLITVDYSGLIVLDMWGFYHNIFYAHKGVVYNRATNKSVCFVHGNGDSYPTWKLEHVLHR